MTWGKMDDKFHRNRKVRELRRAKGGREALGVWVFWWSWCLDGPDLTGVVPAYELDSSELKAAQMLVDHGLWDRVDDGYAFHDFHDYNPTATQVAAKRDADKARIANKRGASRVDVARDIDATNQRVASTRDPDPSRPVPTEPTSVGSPRAPEAMPLLGRLMTEFATRHQVMTRSAFMEHAKIPWTRIDAWVTRTSELRAVDPFDFGKQAIVHWFADWWVTENGYPVAHWAKNFERYAEPPKPKPAARGRPATEPTEYTEDLGEFADV